MLTLSLLQVKKLYIVCWTLSQYLPASWLLIVEQVGFDSRTPFDDVIASVFTSKLDTDRWAPFNDSLSVESSWLLISLKISIGFTVGASGKYIKKN